jgi:hypothetical protein
MVTRRARTLLLITVAIVALVFVAGASAQSVTNPPSIPVSPPGGPPPGRPPTTLTPPPPALSLGYLQLYPRDFHFSETLYGAAFQPGELVAVTADNLRWSAVKATADANGSFSIPANFTWVFCGPGATTHPAPVFHASGSDRSTARVALISPGCPDLEAMSEIGTGFPPINSAGSGAVGSGTAVAIHAGTVSPPGSSTATASPEPKPTPTPIIATVMVRGFGFHPHENVSIKELDFGYGVFPDTSHVIADELGTFSASMKAYGPPPCSSPNAMPALSATGDGGTAVIGHILWRSTVMIACPIMKSQPGQPQPPGSGSFGPDLPGSTSLSLGISLHSVRLKPGQWETATIESGAAGQVSVLVRYPRHGTMQRSVSLRAAGHMTIRWRIPAGAHRGKAHITISLQPGGVSLTQTLSIG